MMHQRQVHRPRKRLKVEEGHNVPVNNIHIRWGTIRLWELAFKKCIERFSRSGREMLNQIDRLAKTMKPHPRKQPVEAWHSGMLLKKWCFF